VNDTLLRTSLLDLLHILRENAGGILLGGGYGLYLKQLHLVESAQRTLIKANLWPTPRATLDLDLMLSTELVANPVSMRAVRAALDTLGYKVIKGAEYLQFMRTVAGRQDIKLDLLTSQLDLLGTNSAIEANPRRARPAAPDRPQLHAHPTDGALMLTDAPLLIQLVGTLSDGTATKANVAIPHPFPYLLMKLTAYRDRRHDPDKDFGQHHAIDLFRILAMLTETHLEEIRKHLRQFADNAQVRSCARVVRTDFATVTSSGILAMRQHPLWQNDAQLSLVLQTLKRLFA
jgi:hypothetical protein